MELPPPPPFSPSSATRSNKRATSNGSRGHSRSRLTSRDSNALSHHRLNRSPSPTDYWRNTRHKKDGISSKVYELNVFIHKGIEKFLDKQAVRDLIIEYDAEDIFIGGIDMFLAGDDMHDLNFSRSEKKRFLDVVDAFSAMNNKTGNPDFADRGGNLARANGGANAAAAAALKNRNKKAAGGGPGGLWGRPRAALWTAFFSAIRIKLFHVHHRQKSARRRESDIFAMYP